VIGLKATLAKRAQLVNAGNGSVALSEKWLGLARIVWLKANVAGQQWRSLSI